MRWVYGGQISRFLQLAEDVSLEHLPALSIEVSHPAVLDSRNSWSSCAALPTKGHGEDEICAAVHERTSSMFIDARWILPVEIPASNVLCPVGFTAPEGVSLTDRSPKTIVVANRATVKGWTVDVSGVTLPSQIDVLV